MIELLKDNEEEALFSKTLATIRKDAPINFEIPEKTFWESTDLKKVEQMFADFEFKSLMARLKNFFDQKLQKESFGAGLGWDRASPQSERRPDKTLLSEVSTAKLQEASIALWLINSDISTPRLGRYFILCSHKRFRYCL